MKTIEERAREEYPYITPSDGYECHDYNEAAKDGFIEGAKWMLEKACEYIKTNIQFTTKIGLSWLMNVLNNLRKQWRNKL